MSSYSSMMGLYQFGTPQSNYMTSNKPGAYDMVQSNYGASTPSYGSNYGSNYDYSQPNPYYEANVTNYPSYNAPAYPPSTYTPAYDVQMDYPPVYDHPGFQAPYISIPTAPPLYMPSNPMAPKPYDIPPPPQVGPAPVATPLAYAPKIAKPLDFGYPPPVQQAPYVNTPYAPYAPSRPGTPSYPPQPPMYFQQQSAPTYYPPAKQPNFPAYVAQKQYNVPYQSPMPNYGQSYNFGAYQAPQYNQQPQYTAAKPY